MVVDFKQFASPDLLLPWGERTYVVPPPSVGDAPKIIAAAILAEIKLGITKTEDVPDGTLEVLNGIAPGEHFSLGSAYAEMQADGVPRETVDAMAFYAIFYWARGERYADDLATLLWAPREAAEVADASPKASSSPRRTGRRGALASRTQTVGSRTTGRSQTS